MSFQVVTQCIVVEGRGGVTEKTVELDDLLRPVPEGQCRCGKRRSQNVVPDLVFTSVTHCQLTISLANSRYIT